MSFKIQTQKSLSEENIRRIIAMGISLKDSINTISQKCVAPYDESRMYTKNMYATYDGYLWVCKYSTTGVFDSTKWEKIGDSLNEITLEEIKNMIGLSQEQIDTLSKIILDSEIRLDKTFSSSKIYMSIQQCLSDSKTYTLEEIGKMSGASYKIASSTSDMTDEKVIYLLQNSSTYDMYIVDGGTPVKIGDTTIDLSDYYTKIKIDNDFLKKIDATSTYATKIEVNDKVDKTSILSATSSTATDDNLYSAKLINEELDKKANTDDIVNKTDIVTTINSTSTDDTIPSAKAVDSRIKNMLICPNDKSPKEFAVENSMNGQTIEFVQWGGTDSDSVGQYTTYKFTRGTDGNWGVLVAIVYDTNYRRNIKYCGFDGYRAEGSKWGKWQKIYATSVEDVARTVVSYDTSVFETGEIAYEVINGICYVRIMALKAKSIVNNYEISSTPMPKPKHGLATCPITCDGDGSNIGMFYVDSNFNSIPKCHMYNTVKNGYCTFSYPVKES